MAWKPHFPPNDRKEYIAQDIREWVQRHNPEADMRSLERMTLLDLTLLMLVLREHEVAK